MKCDGACEEHRGPIERVRIEGTHWGGLEFNYCQIAIERDESSGFVLTRLDTMPGAALGQEEKKRG